MILWISCDFDGVICKRQGIPTKPKWSDPPVEGALETVNYLTALGHMVWISTANPNRQKVRNWLKKNGFPPLKVTGRKLKADVYIDDRAIRFTNWNDIRKYFG